MTDDSKLKIHLIDHSLLTEEQVLRAEDYALTMKIPLDEAIIFLEMFDFAALGQALADLYGKTYHPLLEVPPSDAAKTKLPLKSAERLGVFPVNFNPKNNIMTLAIHDPENKDLLPKLRNNFPPPVQMAFTVASRPEIHMAIEVYYKGKAYFPDIELAVPQEFTITTPDQEGKKELDLEEEHLSNKKILLLEPDLDRSRALATLLKKEGFPNVKWVASKADVVNALKAESADQLLANGRVFNVRGSWLKEIPREIELPPISYYNIKPLLFGQEHPYHHMSDALISLLACVIRERLKDHKEQLREIVSRVRYCKLLALRLGLPPVQVDATILAAWLSDPGLEELRLDQMVGPYGLDEILGPETCPGNPSRIEASILNLVKTYQLLKKNNPEFSDDLDGIRKELGQQFPTSENESLLESFLNVIKGEEFLEGVGQTSGRILIVDPDHTGDSGVALRLSNDGYDVTGAADAAQAAKIIMDSGTDLVISEVNLPGTDGMKFCQILRKNAGTAQLPFFFLTAEEGDRLAADCLKTGADDFLTKPVDLELLCLKIRHILSIKTPKDSKRGINGTLADMSTSDIIQSLTTGDKDVEVNLECKGDKGQIYIQEGEIIHARTGEIEGEDAFYHLMAWQEGEFEIVSCSAFPPRSIHGSTMSLLMEGARLADEIDSSEEIDVS